eukprot:scaffold22132_cov69-Phaeocystis_antarctica.AAC.1
MGTSRPLEARRARRAIGPGRYVPDVATRHASRDASAARGALRRLEEPGGGVRRDVPPRSLDRSYICGQPGWAGNAS